MSIHEAKSIGWFQNLLVDEVIVQTIGIVGIRHEPLMIRFIVIDGSDADIVIIGHDDIVTVMGIIGVQ